jgi:hypothetical protein
LVNRAGNEGDRRRQLKLTGAALQHRRDGAEGGDGCGMEWQGHRRLLQGTRGGERPGKRPIGRRWCSALKWSFHEGEATGRATVTGREEDEAAWLGWAAHAEEGGAVVTSREGGGGTTFGLPEEEDRRVADRVGPPGSDRGREGGCWAGLEAVG